MADNYIQVERRADGVAVVTLDRPKANALSLELLSQLEHVADDLAAEAPGAVLIWGGPRIFAAGADISEFGGTAEAAVSGSRFRATLDKVAALSCPTVAAVAGYALGGGCELALACDLRVAADTAKFGQPEILLGIIPGGGATQRLARLVGAGRAKDLIITGRQIDAAEAYRIGLADRVAPAAELFDTALELAVTLAAGPRVAAAYAKRAIDAGLDGSLSAGLDLEGQLFVDVFATEDAQIGVRSFLESGPGKARFLGR